MTHRRHGESLRPACDPLTLYLTVPRNVAHTIANGLARLSSLARPEYATAGAVRYELRTSPWPPRDDRALVTISLDKDKVAPYNSHMMDCRGEVYYVPADLLDTGAASVVPEIEVMEIARRLLHICPPLGPLTVKDQMKRLSPEERRSRYGSHLSAAYDEWSRHEQ